MANLVVAQLLFLEAEDPKKDIYIYVNSPGGSVTAGLAIIDTMHHIKPDVATLCVGIAASMGSLILSRCSRQESNTAKCRSDDPPTDGRCLRTSD